jgi:hypothetical protein
MFRRTKEQPFGGMMEAPEPDTFSTGGIVVRTVAALLHALYALIRLPVLTLLVILEPAVRVLLAGLALLLVLVAILLELTAPAALQVPFWGLLACGIGCGWTLALYYWVLRLLSA